MACSSGNVRQQFAEAPDAALVKRIARSAAVEPERLQRRRVSKAGRWPTDVRMSERPSGEKEFQQVAASRATEILAGGIGSGAASDAAQFRSGFRILSDRHFALSPEQCGKDKYIIRVKREDRSARRIFCAGFSNFPALSARSAARPLLAPQSGSRTRISEGSPRSMKRASRASLCTELSDTITSRM